MHNSPCISISQRLPQMILFRIVKRKYFSEYFVSFLDFFTQLPRMPMDFFFKMHSCVA